MIHLTFFALLLARVTGEKFLVQTYYASSTCDAGSVVQAVAFKMKNCVTTSSTSSYYYTCIATTGSTTQQTHYFSNSVCTGASTLVNATDSSTCDGAASTWECDTNPASLEWPALGLWSQETVPTLGVDTCIPSEGPDTIFAWYPGCQTASQGSSFNTICSSSILTSYTYNGNTCSSQRSRLAYPVGSCFSYDNGTNGYAACTMADLPGITDSSSNNSGLSKEAIAGISIACIVFVTFVLYLYFVYFKKTEKKGILFTDQDCADSSAPPARTISQQSEQELYESGSDAGSSNRKGALFDKTDYSSEDRRGKHEQRALFAFTKEVKERSLELRGLPSPTSPLLWEQLRAFAAEPHTPPLDSIFRTPGVGSTEPAAGADGAGGIVGAETEAAGETSLVGPVVRMVFTNTEECVAAKARLESQLQAGLLDCDCSIVEVLIMRRKQEMEENPLWANR